MAQKYAPWKLPLLYLATAGQFEAKGDHQQALHCRFSAASCFCHAIRGRSHFGSRFGYLLSDICFGICASLRF